MTEVAHEALPANHEEFIPAVQELGPGGVSYISPDAPIVDGLFNEAVANSAYSLKPTCVVEWQQPHGTVAWGVFEHNDTVSVVPLVPKEEHDGAQFFNWSSPVNDPKDFSSITLGIAGGQGQSHIADVIFERSQVPEDEGRRQFWITAGDRGDVRVTAAFPESEVKPHEDHTQRTQTPLPESRESLDRYAATPQTENAAMHDQYEFFERSGYNRDALQLVGQYFLGLYETGKYNAHPPVGEAESLITWLGTVAPDIWVPAFRDQEAFFNSVPSARRALIDKGRAELKAAKAEGRGEDANYIDTWLRFYNPRYDLDTATGVVDSSVDVSSERRIRALEDLADLAYGGRENWVNSNFGVYLRTQLARDVLHLDRSLAVQRKAFSVVVPQGTALPIPNRSLLTQQEAIARYPSSRGRRQAAPGPVVAVVSIADSHSENTQLIFKVNDGPKDSRESQLWVVPLKNDADSVYGYPDYKSVYVLREGNGASVAQGVDVEFFGDELRVRNTGLLQVSVQSTHK